MAKLRVAHVINGMGFGGVPPLVRQLMAALPRQAFDLRLYCLKQHADDAGLRQNRVQEFADAGIPVRFPDRKETPLQVVARMTGWMQADGIELLHTHSYKPNLYARMAGVLARPAVRVAAHYHNFYDDKWAADGTLALERQLTRSSDVLIACSEAVRTHVAERVMVAPEAIEVVHNGVDWQRFAAPQDTAALRVALRIPDGMKVIAAVGRVSRQKAHDDFLRAARLVGERRTDCLFVVAGADDDPFSPAVKALAAELGLQDRVIFTGHVNDVAPIYALADLVVIPSRWEGFGLVLVEAMAAGTPLVTTAVGPIPEVVGDGNALLIPPDSPAAIAGAVLQILDNPGLADALAARGRLRARAFSWSQAADRVAALYDRLMAATTDKAAAA